ncbi:MAG: hypothetical protein EZS28_022700, partial [Streblomastix strix]
MSYSTSSQYPSNLSSLLSPLALGREKLLLLGLLKKFIFLRISSLKTSFPNLKPILGSQSVVLVLLRSRSSTQFSIQMSDSFRILVRIIASACAKKIGGAMFQKALLYINKLSTLLRMQVISHPEFSSISSQ